MPDHKIRGGESCMSFADLFQMAKERPWTEVERRRFLALDQDTRNEVVRTLARAAGGIRTEDRRGTDGLVYTAFWVEE